VGCEDAPVRKEAAQSHAFAREPSSVEAIVTSMRHVIDSGSDQTRAPPRRKSIAEELRAIRDELEASSRRQDVSDAKQRMILRALVKGVAYIAGAMIIAAAALVVFMSIVLSR